MDPKIEPMVWSTGFEDQYSNGRILREAVSQDTTCRTSSDNDFVEISPKVLSAPWFSWIPTPSAWLGWRIFQPGQIHILMGFTDEPGLPGVGLQHHTTSNEIPGKSSV